jgi:hypothetical protein
MVETWHAIDFLNGKTLALCNTHLREAERLLIFANFHYDILTTQSDGTISRAHK